MSQCRSCGADIVWAKTLTRKLIPLDAKPTPKGNITVVGGIARVVGKGKGQYVSHFATCPYAAEHRQRGAR